MRCLKPFGEDDMLEECRCQCALTSAGLDWAHIVSLAFGVARNIVSDVPTVAEDTDPSCPLSMERSSSEIPVRLSGKAGSSEYPSLSGAFLSSQSESRISCRLCRAVTNETQSNSADLAATLSASYPALSNEDVQDILAVRCLQWF